MVRTNARPGLLFVGVVLISSCLFAWASSLEVQPPNVLQSDVNTCECYLEDAYPSECPSSTPQLDQLCSNISAYQYDETQTEQFCSASCLEALTSCYTLHPGNCSEDVLEYYSASFCSRNEDGQYCVSVGISVLGSISDFVDRCSDADDVCPLPPEPCPTLPLCTFVLNNAVDEFGCCASSLLDHPLSPFANYSIGNTHAYDVCGVELGEKCSAYVEPSVLPPSSTVSVGMAPSSMPSALLASSTPSPSPENGGVSALSFQVITVVLLVVCALCNL